ncbi:hydrolase [Kitasatospora sp. MMS16-BH015]|uniref:YybH family protein n=1 Tax=Kitasatospora sp. MMS16-BH015 TaxID=2018025 RepID=UPI000CA303FE|nr:SgcJ/EcaC family oxidoreductase [Kitasatospora sp. MMS16-BH015]AUG80449.1 hydrolase [Kitasatospora sp. MMS16-BH015]
MTNTAENFELAGDAEEHGRLYVQAFNSGDVEAVNRMYTEDAISVWQPGQPLTGQARKEALAEFLSMRPTMTAELREKHVTGNTALLVVDWQIDVTTPEGPEHLQGTGLDVLRRGEDGKWRFAIDNPFGTEAA